VKGYRLIRADSGRIGFVVYNFNNMVTNKIDVFEDMVYGAQTEFCIFVKIAKGTPVPWTVSADTDQQASTFTGRTDPTLFKSLVRFIFFHWSCNTFWF
jgi:hypothetical protein